MAQRTDFIARPANPFLQVVYFLLAGVVLIGAVLMGAVILAVALGLALIAGVVVYVRAWWLKRKIERSGGVPPGRAGEVLEVEYTVVEERDDQSSEK